MVDVKAAVKMQNANEKSALVVGFDSDVNIADSWIIAPGMASATNSQPLLNVSSYCNERNEKASVSSFC